MVALGAPVHVARQARAWVCFIRGYPPPPDLRCSPELKLWLRLMGDGPDDQDARIPKSVRRYYIAQQGVFADAGVHPPAGRSPIEWDAAVEAATTWHDEILRAVEASSTADEALEGARQSVAETHDELAAALEGDAAAATATLDDRDEAIKRRPRAAPPPPPPCATRAPRMPRGSPSTAPRSSATSHEVLEFRHTMDWRLCVLRVLCVCVTCVF